MVDSTSTAAARRARITRPWGAAALILAGAAVVPAVAAFALGVAASLDVGSVARLLITAIVYAPVAATALVYRRAGVAALTGALAVTTGWLALFALLQPPLQAAFPDSSAPGTAVAVTAHVSRVAELAALGLLPWVVTRDRGHANVGGLVFGSAGAVLSAACSIAGLFVVVPAALILTAFGLALGSFVAAAFLVVLRWRHGTRHERTAWSWLIAGVALTAASYSRIVIPLPEPLRLLTDAAFVLAQGCLPFAVVAVVVTGPLRRRVVDAIALAQSLAFGLSAYLAVLGVAHALGTATPAAGAAAAGSLALVLGSTARTNRARLRALLDDPLPDARHVLARMGERLANDTGDGVREVASSLRDTYRVDSVEIALDGTDHATRVGRRGPSSIQAVLRSGGASIGRITLTATDAAALARLQPVLEETSGFIAAAVQLATVNEEVATTRRRTLEVRREERRLLHRELQDSLAPAIAGIGFGIAAARTHLAGSDSRWLPAVRELREQTAHATEDVRRLARALLPTALDQGDLEGALDELATAMSAEGLAVDIDAHATDVLDDAVQLALYLLIAEAVGEVRRMEGRPGISASVTPSDTTLRVGIRVGGDATGAMEAIAALVRRRADEIGPHAIAERGRAIEVEFSR